MTPAPSSSPSFREDPELDLFLERLVDVPVDLVWKAWTTPEHLKPWFAPKPIETVECEIDLRPGGIFRTVMRDPEGTLYPNVGCYLEIESPHRLVWTTALGPGYRPLPDPVGAPRAGTELRFTAELTFEPVGDSTRYSVRAIHATREVAAIHDEMGFSSGWSTAVDQLVDHMAAVAGR
ncbi:MAG: SRPBCC family protein [Nitriliruptorales bacterium]